MTHFAVFCGASTGHDPVYMETARQVGRMLAERGSGVVYGGGHVGLMGAVEDLLNTKRAAAPLLVTRL